MRDETLARPVVVGLDGSSASQAALQWALAYAGALGVEVVAVHAFEERPHFSYPYNETAPAELPSGLRDSVRKCFEEDWSLPLAQSGLNHRLVMANGKPADVLLRVAEEEGAQVVVTGRRGLNALGELLLGSVSHNLVHTSRRPVVLVPSG